jgi:class 3 adenylate cyclase
MDYQVRYVRSADGTIIAVMMMGQGPPIVSVSGIANFASFAGDYATPYRTPFYDGLAQERTLVTYDPRGIGLSQRDVEDVSIEAHLADLAAVVESLGPGPFAFHSGGATAPVAVRYLVEHPDRASHLILTGPSLRGSDRQLGERLRLIAPVFDYDFDLWVRFFLLMDAGWKDGARIYEAIGSSAIDKDMLMRQLREVRRWDMSDDLPRLTCQTLVMYSPTPDSTSAGLDSARRVAAAIPQAEFKTLAWEFETNAERQLAAYLAFLNKGQAKSIDLAPPPSSGGLAVILFADIVDSTAHTERLGDAAFRERSSALDDKLRLCVRDHGGAVIDAKTLGDGILATFPAASQAISAALSCAAAGQAQDLPLHLGIHAGDVIREQNNVFGGAVNIASRISALSAPGEVLVSDVVRALARTSANVTFEDRGEHALKGVGEPQRVYAVRREGA